MSLRTISLCSMLLLAGCLTRAGTPFSAMGVEDVSILLALSDSARTAPSAKEADACRVHLPVPVTAEDLVAKVYGVVDTRADKAGCISEAQRLMSLTPEEDLGMLWLETDGGYGVNYYGMIPPVSAMARYGDGVGSTPHDRLSDFGYFFLFPYENGAKQQANSRQADFCGNLLQEMADTGFTMGVETSGEDLFEAVGYYSGNQVDVRLLDDQHDDGSGRFILILSVEPPRPLVASD